MTRSDLTENDIAQLMSVRQARDEDLAGILALYRELNPDDTPLAESSALAIWQEIQLNPKIVYFVAEHSGALIGSCNLTIIPNLTRNGSPFGVIENVIVDGRCRRSGVGKALMDAAVEHARSHSCYKVTLTSSAKRTEAHRFYERVGFNGDSKRGYEIRF